jgi:hypothetical protein
VSVVCPWFIAAFDPELCRSVDHYCERTSPAFDAEPINALTNLAFLVAGFMAWRLQAARRDGSGNGLVGSIIFIIPIVGLGSILFHTIAVRWAEWGDVVPILVFMLLYLWLVARRFLGWPFRLSGLALSVFFAATFYLEAWVPDSFLWGGAMYLPTVLVLIILGLVLPRHRPAVGRPFFIAVGVFLVSFTARTLDAPLCAYIPIGTHFLWHILNAVLLYLLARIVILHAPLSRK